MQVHYRVGSLENAGLSVHANLKVHYRVGSLEIMVLQRGHSPPVHYRVGSLETANGTTRQVGSGSLPCR